MKVHFVMAFCERPHMATIAINSVVHNGYDDWVLTIVDDSSFEFGEAWRQKHDMLPADWALHYITYPINRVFNTRTVAINDTYEMKSRRGSRHGSLMNESFRNVEADLVIPLCDDDAIVPGAVPELVKFYNTHPQTAYSYSYVIPFNPLTELPNPAAPRTRDGLNRHDKPIKPSCNVDSSQVTFRKSCFDNPNIGYPEQGTAALDSHLFTVAAAAFGDCPPNKIYLQFKGMFHDQLGNRRSGNMFKPIDRERPI